MANAVRAVTTERGLDPRDFALIAYGGAGPLHAVDVARELAIRTVVIPQAPGKFSAYGMLTADLRREYAQTYRAPLTDEGLRGTTEFFTTLETEASAWLRSAGVPSEHTLLEHAIDVPGLERLELLGLAERHDETLTLTARGRFLGDGVTASLLA